MSNEFDGDPGIKDDYDGTITAATFEQGQYNNWQLRLHIDADDGEGVDLVFSVGGADKGWVSVDGGLTIEGGPKKGFSQNSAVQKMIAHVMKTDASTELLRRSAEYYDKRGPNHSQIWVGLRFHFDVEKETRNRLNAETREWEPVEGNVTKLNAYLGVIEDGVQGKLAPPAPASNGSGISEATLTQLRILAGGSSSAREFADMVMAATEAETGQPMLKNKAVLKKLSATDQFFAELSS
jgi:hypothetical protein